jgi:putative Ca2+/H+ antiporter (TMEM165/GDT1 family)
MDWKIFLATFGSVFLAEMGDKTQLACLTMTAQSKSPWVVLLATLAALSLASVLGVAVGCVIGQAVPAGLIKRLAGGLFIVIGGLMLLGRW